MEIAKQAIGTKRVEVRAVYVVRTIDCLSNLVTSFFAIYERNLICEQKTCKIAVHEISTYVSF